MDYRYKEELNIRLIICSNVVINYLKKYKLTLTKKIHKSMEDRNQPEQQAPANLIKISSFTRVNNVLRFANVLLKERNFREIHFRALGASIGKLVSAVELLKLINGGLYQTTTIGTVAFQQKDTNGKVNVERLYPKLEITLSLDEPKQRGEGYQPKLSEEERKKLLDILDKQRSRGPRGGRGGPRGGRGFRGGPRDGRGFRGGPRDGRGFRGGPRGGRGFRGGPRDESGFRGPRDESGFRGGRGTPRGGPRGGRGAPRGRGASRGRRPLGRGNY